MDQVERFKAIFNDALENFKASVYASDTGYEPGIRVVTLALDTAKLETQPYEVGFPFQSFFVYSATDSAVSVNMRVGTPNSSQDKITLKTQSSLKLPEPVRKAYLDWSAQAGKTITIMFFVRGEFATNQITSITSGGVVITEGDAVAIQSPGSVTTVAAALFAADAGRKKMVIQNQSGAEIWIGDSAVTTDTGAKPGIKLQAGATYEWMSTAACYAVTAAGTASPVALIKFS